MTARIESSDDFARRLYPHDASMREHVADIVRQRDSQIVTWCILRAKDAHVRSRKSSSGLGTAKHYGRAAAFESVNDALSRPVACRQCSKPVEDGRRYYAVPTCHACLPPPPQLPTIEVP